MSRIHTRTNQNGDINNKEGTKRLGLSILLNLAITLAEIIGGVYSGSLSLLSDALHNFSDTASLGISLVAFKISTRGADRKNTFGYRRAQIIGALINLITLVLIAVYLIKEALDRYFNPRPILGSVMLVVAIIGLLANLATAALLYRQSKNNLNIRSAFIHIMGDAFSSVGAAIRSLSVISVSSRPAAPASRPGRSSRRESRSPATSSAEVACGSESSPTCRTRRSRRKSGWERARARPRAGVRRSSRGGSCSRWKG